MTESYQAEFDARFGDGVEPADFVAVSDEPALRRLLTRRTHRRFTAAQVSDGLLRLLLAAAFSASSKSDFQQASAIVVGDADKRRRLGALFPEMPWIGTAPTFLVFCGDARRLECLGALHGHRLDNGGLEGFFNATVDAALALQTFILAAETVALGCCPISVLRNQIDAVAEILSLPDKVFPVAGLCVGYPSQPGFVSMRLPLAATVYRDGYDDSRLAEVVDAYDRRRDARFSIPRDRQRGLDTYGPADFYGWSEDKARQAAGPEGVGFAEYLRTGGFSFD